MSEHTAEKDALTSETGLPLTPSEAARYFAWAHDDPDPYRRGFAAGVAAATRVTPPAVSHGAQD